LLISLVSILIAFIIPVYSGVILLSWGKALRKESGAKRDRFYNGLFKYPFMMGCCLWAAHFPIAMFIHNGCELGPENIVMQNAALFIVLFGVEFLLFYIGVFLAIYQSLNFLGLFSLEKGARNKSPIDFVFNELVFLFWQFTDTALSGIILGYFTGLFRRSW
jgi:hypothetical protein